ncbi:unnamed protein product [Symbiodinium sp. CCMP2592]|nr:unnamed protein product [Symbiodinium sp. CCMP2592]CAE7751442.1 unnamed protein product [Symbiodinium sp. CCMP2592]CAE7832429.1 unnamed protein product [Symbiodinium sp. CCMP2592]
MSFMSDVAAGLDAEAYLAGLRKQQAEDSPSPLSEAVQTASPKLTKACDVTPEKISPPKPDEVQSPAPAASCSPQQVEPTQVDPYLDTASDGPAIQTTPERYTATLASLGLDREVEETGSLTPTEMEVDEAGLWKTYAHVSHGDLHERYRKTNGRLDVPEEVHAKWKQGGNSRRSLLKVLISCKGKPDRDMIMT